MQDYLSASNMEAIHAGWLTKSPRDKKGLFSLFSSWQKWRRRYFVLFLNSSRSSFIFNYYEDESLEVKKGKIDLEKCEEIIDHVESCYYKHIFLLKTIYKGQRRTYYLAADSEDLVTSWAEKLHQCLDLYEDRHFLHEVQSSIVKSKTKSSSNSLHQQTANSALQGSTLEKSVQPKSTKKSIQNSKRLHSVSKMELADSGHPEIYANANSVSAAGTFVLYVNSSLNFPNTETTHISSDRFTESSQMCERFTDSNLIANHLTKHASDCLTIPSTDRIESFNGSEANDEFGRLESKAFSAVADEDLKVSDFSQIAIKSVYDRPQENYSGQSKVKSYSVNYASSADFSSNICSERETYNIFFDDDDKQHTEQKDNDKGSSQSSKPSGFVRLTAGSRRYRRKKEHLREVPGSTTSA